MIRRLRAAWWLMRNQNAVFESMDAAERQLSANAESMRRWAATLADHDAKMAEHIAFYVAEIRLLREQTEIDSLMIQAYANWCAAQGCLPTLQDLERASGRSH